MNEWKSVAENFKSLNSVIEKHYFKHHNLIRYLDYENLMKIDLTVKEPSHNVSQDVEQFMEKAELVSERMELLEKLHHEKEFSQILQKTAELIELQKFFDKVSYLLQFKKEDKNESLIFQIYEPIFKIAATSTRPFIGFTQMNYDTLTRLKWRWLD